MKKKWIFLASLLLIFLIFTISYLEEQRIMKKQQEKYYDWQMRATFWARCGSYFDGVRVHYDELDQEIRNYFQDKEFKIEKLEFDKYPHEVVILTTLKGKTNLTDTNWIDVINSNISCIFGGEQSEAIHSVTIYWNKIIDTNITQKVPIDEKELVSCEVDSDCIKVNDGCCGCSAGGKARTINQAYSNYWNEKLSKECKNTVCITVISNDPTCFADPRCVERDIVWYFKERTCELAT